MEKEYRCKNCGGNLIMQSNLRTARCDSCDTLFEIDDNRTKFVNPYTQADDAWSRKDFDEAIKYYEQIVAEDNTQSEAHWGIALCRYGIAYELDPIKLIKMPTCNRINRDSILNDKNYLSAIKYAGDEARKIYQQRAEEIDKISRDFLKIVDKEEPYDVFISYKRTDADGRRTADSMHAMKLYLFLRDNGIRTFFAEQTLRDVSGEKYEPYIFAALNSARVMVLVGSCKAHVEATWVKNEWHRFMKLTENDPKKVLIPAYLGDDVYDIFPQELLSIQACDMKSPVFREEITENIKKKLEGKVVPKAGKGLEERYASPDVVEKLVQELDCDPQFAVDALVRFQGKASEARKFIQNDPAYQKALWHCAVCGTTNTHDVCRNAECALPKSESLRADRMRKEEEDKKRRQSYAYKQKRLSILKTAGAIIGVLAVLAALIFGLIIPYLVTPNLENPDLYTPDIVKAYCATKDSSTSYEQNKWEYIFTILSCDQDGNITASKEIVHNNVYGKYNLTGKITSKKNNGKITIEFQAQPWVIELADFERKETFTATISKDHTQLSGDSITYSAGGDEQYNIATAADLQKLVNSDGLFLMKNDIDLTGSSFTPIEGFTGILIGNGYTIQGLEIDASNGNVGFFATLGGIVNNLNFENAKITVSGRQENVGILCGTLDGGMAMNVTTSGSVSADTGTNVGGMIGKVANLGSYSLTGLQNSATVEGMERVGGVIGGVSDIHDKYQNFCVDLHNMENTGAIQGAANVGGIVGHLEIYTAGNNTIKLNASGLHNTGDITGESYVGGIFGYAAADDLTSVMQDCSSKSAITAEAYAGCIAGATKNIIVNNCSNAGSTLTATGQVVVDGEKYAYVGGFVGHGYVANNCTNEVTISYTGTGRYVGGIFGLQSATGDYSMTSLKNNAPISGYSYVGGIFGSVINQSDTYKDFTLELTKFENTASVTGSSQYVGGIIGHLDIYSAGNNCTKLNATVMTNTGDVSGDHFVGGIFGYANSDSIESVIQDCSNSSAISAQYYVGCIAGHAGNININDCTNEGSTLTATGQFTEDGNKYAYVGGFAGYAFCANNCTNEVAINYTGNGYYVGGIIGCTKNAGSYSMSDLKNNAPISGYAYVGGIYGCILNRSDSYKDFTVEINNFENTAKIYGSSQYVGGIIGYFEASSAGNDTITLYGSELVNSGSVSGVSNVGQLFGSVSTDSGNSSLSDCETLNGSVSGKI